MVNFFDNLKKRPHVDLGNIINVVDAKVLFRTIPTIILKLSLRKLASSQLSRLCKNVWLHFARHWPGNEDGRRKTARGGRNRI